MCYALCLSMSWNLGVEWRSEVATRRLEGSCVQVDTVAQTTVPMFACFALNSILCNRTLTPFKSMSVWNKVLTHGFLAIQESEDLIKIWLHGSHTKMTTHWTVFWLFTCITYIRPWNAVRGLHTLGSGCIMSILCNQWEYSIFQSGHHKYIFFLLLSNILTDNIDFLAFLILSS